MRFPGYRVPLARVRSAAAAVSAVGLVATFAACDPCSGVISCTDAPRVGVSGQIVDGSVRDAQRAPPGVGGVRVEVTRVSGVETDRPSASARSDGTGWWSVSLPAREVGEVLVDIAVTPPPPGLPYRLAGVPVRASRSRGDGSVLGRWVARPHITLVGAIIDRASGAPVAGANVTVVRRGGILVDSTGTTRNPSLTTEIGYFLYDVRPQSYGSLVVDLVVERPGRRAVTIPNVDVVPDHEWGPPRASGRYTFQIDDAGPARAAAPGAH